MAYVALSMTVHSPPRASSPGDRASGSASPIAAAGPRFYSLSAWLLRRGLSTDREGGERSDTGLSDLGPGMGLGREGPSAQALMPPGPRDDLRAGAGAGEGAEADGAEAAAAEDDHLPEDDQEAVLDSVVKVFAVGSSPNYRLPWQNKPQREVTGSGFVIMGRRILTSAHIVADQAFVLVRKHGSPKKYLAQIEIESYHQAFVLVRKHGSPKKYLAQNLTGAENIGYIVPTPIIHRFLHDAALHHRRFSGFSSLGVACQPLDNWQLRAHLRLPPTATGVLVNAVQPLSESSRWIKKDDTFGFSSLGVACQPLDNWQLRAHLCLPPTATGVLVNAVQPLSESSWWIKKDDVLTAFDCVPIADDGSVLFRKRERLPFDYLVSLKGSGERARVSVYRGGQLMHFDMTVNPLPPLVPAQQFDSAPSYFIFAGLVFMPLSQPYLHEYGPDWIHSSPRRLCDLALRNLPEKPGQQIIILSRVLPDEVNSGYERLADLQVLKVNGMEVDNIRQLKDAVLETSGPFVRFDLEDGRIIAIDMAAARKSNAQILRRYRVPSASSWDLRQMADSHSHDSHSRF
ncbi:unnamed protein product [Closterium sp. Yama58-4]|nr:unnamed protein product [Closterium sp. Yama58-4]